MSKVKGSRAERELFRMFWEAKWHTVRSAGSGSTPMPSPDLIVGNVFKQRVLAIECKALKGKRKYLPLGDVEQLQNFAQGFGAEPWVGVRFDNIGWFFFKTEELLKSKGESFVVSLDFAYKNGLNFEELIGLYKQKRLDQKS